MLHPAWARLDTAPYKDTVRRGRLRPFPLAQEAAVKGAGQAQVLELALAREWVPGLEQEVAREWVPGSEQESGQEGAPGPEQAQAVGGAYVALFA